MKYRIILVLLCAALVLTLAACTDDYEPVAEPETLPETIEPEEMPEVEVEEDLESYGDFEEEMTDADYHGLPDDYEPPEMSGEHNPELVEAFTPEDAYIHTDVESFFFLTSYMSKDEMIVFVMDVIEELGIVITSIDEPWEDTVTYTGTLADGGPIHIEIREGYDGVGLMLLY